MIKEWNSEWLQVMSIFSVPCYKIGNDNNIKISIDQYFSNHYMPRLISHTEKVTGIIKWNTIEQSQRNMLLQFYMHKKVQTEDRFSIRLCRIIVFQDI